MKNLFTDHPNSVNETYFEHMKMALRFSFQMLCATFACFIHAFFPFLFEHTGGKKVHCLVKMMKASGRWGNLESMFGPTEPKPDNKQ